jgi:hypothetical protein
LLKIVPISLYLSTWKKLSFADQCTMVALKEVLSKFSSMLGQILSLRSHEYSYDTSYQ